MRVVLSDRARRALLKIAGGQELGAPSGPQVGARIGQVIEMLADYPTLGAAWNDETRAVEVKGLPYRVHFRLRRDAVEVATVLRVG